MSARDAGKSSPLAWLAATISGVMVFLAFPNWDIHWLAWFAHVPLLLAARDASPRAAMRLGLWAGFITNFGGFFWMPLMLHDFGHLPWPICYGILALQAVTQGLTMVVAMGAWRWLARLGAPSAASAWLALWLGEAIVPMIFPWFLGNGITHETQMIQIADLGGVHLVSALLYASNVAIAELGSAALQQRRPALRFVTLTACAVVATWFYGGWRIDDIDAEQAAAPKLRVGLVEGDVGIWEKEARHLDGDERVRTLRKNLLKHQRMSAELEAAGVDLIVWPESAYQPYGAVPVIYSADRFGLIGANGTKLRHDGAAILPLARTASEEAGAGLLTGLSSPRGDVWRWIRDGKAIATSAPWSQSSVAVPEGEVAVDTAAAGTDMMGRMRPGYVLTRSGRVFALEFPPEPARAHAGVSSWQGVLSELTKLDEAPFDATAIGVSGADQAVIVGGAGAVAEVQGHALQRVDAGLKGDLWDVAGDPMGALLVAVGADGLIAARVSGGSWRVEHRGGPDLLSTFFDHDGAAWAAGKGGTLLHRVPGGSWKAVASGQSVDFVAGAADARGHLLLLGRGGKAFERDGNGTLRAVATGTERELTDVIGYQAQANWSIPRRAKRLLPSGAALPAATLGYPADVISDETTPEFDRSTPRRGFSAPLLFGAMTFGGEMPMRNSDCEACFNSALLLDKDGEILELYDKAFLLVFGEYMPFGERFPELYDLLPESSRFQPGTRTEPIRLGDASLGLLICYEDLLPSFARRVMAHNPEMLINLTNDAWFGQTAEPYHHLQLAQLRAVEYRRWLVRSTNTGVSVFIDAAGRRVAETALIGAETLVREVPRLQSRTLYARFGDWPLAALAAGLFWLLGRALRGGDEGGKGRSAKGRAGKAAGRSRAKKPTKPASPRRPKPEADDEADAEPPPAKRPKEKLEPARLG